jgi:hypothetical protein
MYPVYLLPEWRELGIDHPTRERADETGDHFRALFPHLRDVVRPCAS